MIKIIALLFTTILFAKEVGDLSLECDSGKADSCFEAAYIYSQNGDQIRPVKLFEKACDLKDGKSCYALDKILKKLKRSNGSDQYLDLSCEYSFPKACFEISNKLLSKRALLKSMKVLEKSCSLNYEAACIELEKRNEYFSRVVRSSEKELNKEELEDQKIYLVELNSRITDRISKCENKKFDQCTEAAKDYLFLANVKAARKWSEIACQNSMPLGCLTLGEVEQKEGHKELPSFEKACELKSSIGCFRFAQSIEQANLAKGMSFYRRSCEDETNPIADACKIYSDYNSKNEIVSKKFSVLACKLDKKFCKK